LKGMAGRQFVGHKTDFDEGTDSIDQQAIIDVVDVRKVIDGCP